MSIDRWKRIWGISGSQDNGANQFVVNLNESVLPPEKLTSMTFRLDSERRIKKTKSDWWITVLLVCQVDQKND